MKALKIDTKLKKVIEIDIDKGINAIYKEIGNGCDTFSCPVTLDNNDALYCDDEGLFHEFDGGIMMKDWAYPIVGNMLIIGTDNEGDSVDCKTTKEEIEKKIIWVSKEKCTQWAEQFR